MARVAFEDEDGSIVAGRIALALALEKTFGLCMRGEVCKRSFDSWRTISLCNAAKGEIFTRQPVR